uniref:Uncharacterized protein n=1 Tax=Compsopogon caeruleus TaxID=31354 RepID=A0A7S1T5P2_9RHOD|mmetsp:Transcript_11005/g.21960  ORF Transcript_11005/g.21960 Transcript_11005/m.21960 type:complete len:343 (+) Transcript_11005:56-1084(+)
MDDEERKAEVEFEQYEFENDDGYHEFRNAVTVVGLRDGRGEADRDTERVLRRKYFRQKVNSKLRKTSTTTSSSGQAPPTSGSARSVPQSYPGSAQRRVTDTFDEVIRRISRDEVMFVIHTIVWVSALMTILPWSSGMIFYRKVHTAAIVAGTMTLFLRVGRPRLDRRWVVKALRTQDAQYLFFSFIFRVAPYPEILSVLPPAIFSLYAFLDSGVRLTRLYVPTQWHIHLLPIAAKAIQIRPQATLLIPMVEPSILGMQILKLLFGHQRQLFLVLSFFQFCRWRYQLSVESRQLWGRLDERATGVLQSFPSALQMYQKLRSLVSQTGTILDIAQAAQPTSQGH